MVRIKVFFIIQRVVEDTVQSLLNTCEISSVTAKIDMEWIIAKEKKFKIME